MTTPDVTVGKHYRRDLQRQVKALLLLLEKGKPLGATRGEGKNGVKRTDAKSEFHD